jgi:hypothetical protein
LIHFIAPAAPNKGIQRSAKSGRPLMPGVGAIIVNQSVLEAILAGRCPGYGRTQRARVTGLILGVETNDLNTLLSGASLDAVSKREIFEDYTLVDGIGLIFDDSKFDDLVDDHAADQAFHAFLNSAYIGCYHEQFDRLELVSPHCLSALLPECIPELTTIPLIAGSCLTGADLNRLRGVHNFCGTHSVCSFTYEGITCGEKLCHAEHSWIQQGVCLCYMHSGTYVTAFYTYPFRT